MSRQDGMKDWPPQPGLTDMIRTKSRSSRTSSRVLDGRGRVERRAGLAAERPDHGQVLVEVGRRLDVERDPVGPGLVEQGHKGAGVLDHEVDVDGQAGFAADGRDELGAEGQVGHEMPVHDVDVDEIGPGLLGQPDGLAEPREIGGQDRRGDEDHQRLTSSEMRFALAGCGSRSAGPGLTMRPAGAPG